MARTKRHSKPLVAFEVVAHHARHPKRSQHNAYLSAAVRRAERGDTVSSMAAFIKLAGVVGMDQFLVEAIDR